MSCENILWWQMDQKHIFQCWPGKKLPIIYSQSPWPNKLHWFSHLFYSDSNLCSCRCCKSQSTDEGRDQRATLRRIRSIRRSVTRPVLQSLVAALTLTRLDYGCTTLAGLPARQLNRLQSVLKAAVRLVYSARRSKHVSPLLRDLHWLRVPERIEFRLAVLVYRCLSGTAPLYLARELQRVSDIDSRRRLRSASSASLLVPRTNHVTIGYRAFPVAAAKVWNSLPPSITSLPSLLAFRRALKTELFRRSHCDAPHQP
jgi:hypothetical protein